MSNDCVWVNVRKTDKGEPKGSFTVHRKGCRTAAAHYRAESPRWATSTLDRVSELQKEILFGTCKRCLETLARSSAHVETWVENGPSTESQMGAAKAKTLLERD